MLIKAGISNKVDDTGVTVGKRYARTDECGIPFAITVDHDTLEDETVTLRDLDSMKQIRLPIKDVSRVVSHLIAGIKQWDDMVDLYGLVNGTQSETKQEKKSERAVRKPHKKEKGQRERSFIMVKPDAV